MANAEYRNELWHEKHNYVSDLTPNVNMQQKAWLMRLYGHCNGGESFIGPYTVVGAVAQRCDLNVQVQLEIDDMQSDIN